ARAAAKGEVRDVALGESRAVRASAGEDAAGGDVAPGHAGFGAGAAYQPGQYGVAREGFGLAALAGIDVRLAGVARAVDQELRARVAQVGAQAFGVGVV